jgi:hypothetical protein
MKNLFLAGLFIMSTNVFASNLVAINNLTNPILDNASSKLVALDIITHSGKQKVTMLKGKGKTVQELRQNAVSQALHILCPFFDDGVRIRLNTKTTKGTLNAVADLLDSSSSTEGDAEYKAIYKEISTINNTANVEVYSGIASGNNTAGTVLGFYDVTNNEIGLFSNTNCGSDN